MFKARLLKFYFIAEGIQNRFFSKKYHPLRWYLNLLLLPTFFLQKQNGISAMKLDLESKRSRNRLATATVHYYFFLKIATCVFQNTQRVI